MKGQTSCDHEEEGTGRGILDPRICTHLHESKAQLCKKRILRPDFVQCSHRGMLVFVVLVACLIFENISTRDISPWMHAKPQWLFNEIHTWLVM